MNGNTVTLRNKNTGEIVTLRKKTAEPVSQEQQLAQQPQTTPVGVMGAVGKGLTEIIPGTPYAANYWLARLSKSPAEAMKEAGQMEKTISGIRPQGTAAKVAEGATVAAGRIPFYMAAMKGLSTIPALAGHPIISGSLGYGGVSGLEEIIKGQPQQAIPSAITSAATYPFMHGAGKIGATAIPKRIPGAERIGSALGFGAVAGGLAPEGERTEQALLGAGLGAMFPAKRAELFKFTKPKYQLQLAENTRNALVEQKQEIMNKYGDVYDKTIKKGKGYVSLQEPLKDMMNESDDIINTIKGQKEVAEAIGRGDPTAKKIVNIIDNFLTNPEVEKKIDNLSLREADSLVKYIKNLSGIKTKLAKGYRTGKEQVDFTNAERILLNFANDIKSKVLDLAPEMSLMNREYGNFMTTYKQIRPYLKWDRAVTTFKNIHKLDPAVSEKIRQILPAKITNDIVKVNRAERALDIVKMLARYGIMYKVGESLLRNK